jgi:hypothetical protein
MKSNAGRNAAVARQQNRPASPTRQKHEDLNAQSSAAVRRARPPGFARHDGNWHHDWDKHHAHFDHGHVLFLPIFWGTLPMDYIHDAYGSYPWIPTTIRRLQ